MHQLALVFACLAFAGTGRRARTSSKQPQLSTHAEKERSLRVVGSKYDAHLTARALQLLRATATLFRAGDPVAGFSPYRFSLEAHHGLRTPSRAGVPSLVRDVAEDRSKRFGHHPALMSASEVESGVLPQLDVAGLKKEVIRQQSRAVKKVTKANERLRKAKEASEKSMANPEASEEDLEKDLQNLEDIEKDLQSLQERAKKLVELDDILKEVKSAKSERYREALELATLLEVGDAPPERPPPKPKKPKGPRTSAPRKPYLVYTSADNLEIRVGRQAPDNDELSLKPEYRDGRDWWMHVSGSAGSHVVIRYHDDLPANFPETVKDAALLAVTNSKGPQSGNAKVSLVRANQVSKPAGAKAGLVQLSGDIQTVKINAANQKDRMERLMATKSTGQ